MTPNKGADPALTEKIQVVLLSIRIFSFINGVTDTTQKKRWAKQNEIQKHKTLDLKGANNVLSAIINTVKW